MSTITAQIQLRRDTSTNWTANNPVLLAGEMALSTDVLYTGTDQPRYKIGNGVDTWLNLDYVPEGGGGNSYPENLFLTVVNKTGDNLLATNYKVLKVQTAQGQRLAVDYALANNDANSADTIGIAYENIDNNQTGLIVVIGEIININTTGSLQGETWTDGDILYLSPTVEGGITNVRPMAPNHGVIIGYVVYSHVNNGKIYCKINNGYEIGELHDVYAPSPTHNQGIFWSSGTTRYENKSVSSALGYTPENTSNKSIDGTFAANSDTLYPSQKAVKTYADSLVTGLLDDRGNYNASSNLFPSTGGSGAAGAILKGDLWYISTGGALGGTPVVVGSSVRALVDSPGQTSTNWSILNVGVGYTPENSANKGIANGYASLDSTGKVPSSQLPTISNLFYQTVGHASTAQGTALYFYGAIISYTAFTSNSIAPLTIYKTGIINEAFITIRKINASSGTVQIKYSLNGGSFVTLTTIDLAVNATTAINTSVSGLSIAVNKGDTISFQNNNTFTTSQTFGTLIDFFIQ